MANLSASGLFADSDSQSRASKDNISLMKNRIRELRNSRGWTLQELADVVGTSKGYLSDIEKDKREPSIAMLRAIADALQSPPYELFASESDSDTEVIRLIQGFLQLSDEDRQAVLRHAYGLLPGIEKS